MISHKYITLEELMKQFNPKLMIAIGQASVNCSSSPTFGGIIAALTTCDVTTKILTDDQDIWLEANTPTIKAVFVDLYKQIEQMGLDVSASTAKEIADAFDTGSPSARNLTKLSNELCKNLKIQMGKRLFYSIDLDKQGYITDLFGDDVAKSFSSATFDIQEASQCLAFDRWTAAVFHLSRVAEIATVTICKRVGYKSAKPGFGEALNYMDSNLEKARKDYEHANPLFKGNIEFLSTVTAQMHAVNDAWRKHVSHMDKKYTGEEAVRIWDTTKALMQQLALELKEEADA